MPEPTNLALRDLKRLSNEATAADLPLLAYLLDMAIIEAREQAGKQ